MSSVEPRSLLTGYEKLGTVGVFTRVSHREPTGAVMLEFEVFVIEFIAINTVTTRSVAIREVSAFYINFD